MVKKIIAINCEFNCCYLDRLNSFICDYYGIQDFILFDSQKILVKNKASNVGKSEEEIEKLAYVECMEALTMNMNKGLDILLVNCNLKEWDVSYIQEEKEYLICNIAAVIEDYNKFEEKFCNTKTDGLINLCSSCAMCIKAQKEAGKLENVERGISEEVLETNNRKVIVIDECKDFYGMCCELASCVKDMELVEEQRRNAEAVKDDLSGNRNDNKERVCSKCGKRMLTTGRCCNPCCS